MKKAKRIAKDVRNYEIKKNIEKVTIQRDLMMNNFIY